VLQALFQGHFQSSRSVIRLLNEFAQRVHSREFGQASYCIDVCIQGIGQEGNQPGSPPDELRLNQLYVIGAFLSTLRDYSDFWSKITNRDYAGSWDTLQSVRDGLCTVRRFTNGYHLPALDFIEQQVVSLERLYPYRIFASIEAIVHDVKCSICGNDINSLDCPHIQGGLYAGKMAYEIVGSIETLLATSLVRHPADKRCVVQLANTESNFVAVAYLANMLCECAMSPWQLKGTKETTRKKKITEFGELGESDKCPCGSGKTLGHCCLKIGYVEVPHIELLVGKAKVPTFEVGLRVCPGTSVSPEKIN
jgi:hypothetical protein